MFVFLAVVCFLVVADEFLVVDVFFWRQQLFACYFAEFVALALLTADDVDEDDDADVDVGSVFLQDTVAADSTFLLD